MPEIEWQALWPLILFAGVLLLMFWLIVMRPIQQQRQRQKQLIADLSEGEHVITAGGIHGKIVALREDDMDVQVADGCVMTFDRRAVRKTRA